jgi:1-acyl-sn-glycerol-3-phosphate acyltransferase
MPRHKLIPMLFQRLAWGPVRLVIWLFAGLEIKGIENLKRIRGNFIIASNHTNQLDPVLLVACFPFFSKHIPLMFASREKDFYAKSGWKRLVYGGTFFRLMGAHPMYGGLNNYEAALQHHLEFARKGESICIFPTGKKRNGITPQAKGGVGYLVRVTDLPIVPVKIDGLEGMSLLSVWTGKHEVTVTFGAPLYAKDVFMNTAFIQLTQDKNPYTDAAVAIMKSVEQLT